MAKQLTAPGCIYSIVVRVDTTIYSPDQNWVLDVPAGQHDFIAETNEVIIPADAMMRRKTRQHAKDRNRINLLGIGPGSLVSFITRAIERIVGKGNVTVTYEDGKMTVVLAASVTYAQVAMVESLLDRMLPKDVTEEISDAPIGYTRLEFLKSDGNQSIETFVPVDSIDEIGVTYGNGTGAMFEAAASLANALLFYADGDYVFRLDYGGVFAARLAVPSGKKQILFSLEKSQIDINGSVRSVEKKADFTLQPYQFWFSERHKIPVHSYKGKLYEAKIIKNNTKRLWLIPTLDPAGVPCMFDAVTRVPFYNKGTGQFIAGMTTDQALNLADLPITGDGALTVSLPWEDQWDAGVQNALDTASTNGWTITVQYRDPDVGTENIPISFLESTGTQYIDTGIKLSNESRVLCEFSDVATIDGMLFGARQALGVDAFCATVSTYYVSYGNYYYRVATDVTEGKLDANKNKWTLNNHVWPIEEMSFETPVAALLFAMQTPDGIDRRYLQGRVYAFSIARNNRSQLNFIPALDRTGRPCMFDAVTGKLFYNAATTGPDFIVGMTWEQVRKLQLPTTGGQLTLSLPYEASIDGIAQTALDRARANGWELTLQYDEAEVPEGYSKLDFLESTGVQWIDTGIKLSNERAFKITCEFFNALEPDGNSHYAFGVGSASIACYAVLPTRYMPHFYLNGAYVAFDAGTQRCVTEYTNNYAILNSVKKVFSNAGEAVTTTDNIAVFACRQGVFPFIGRIYTFNISRSNSLQLAYIPCLDQAGVPCMFDLVSHQSFYNKGAGQFTAGMTWEQVRKLHLPAPGGKLTLALPYEASIDSLTQAALEQARENGWELTLQYADVELPAGYSKLDFLESTGTQRMVIPFENNGAVTTTLEMQWTDIAGRQLLGYNSNSLYFGVNDQTESGWDYGSTEVWKNYSPLDKHQFAFFVNADGADGYVSLNETKLNRVNSAATLLEQFYLLSLGGGTYTCMARVFSCYIVTEAGLVRNLVPCLDPEGIPCMYDTVTHQPFRNNGTGQFTAGMTLEQVRDLSLPAGGGQLTLALPYEASLDGLAQDALERARANGWVLTLQYDEAVVPAGYRKLDFLESTGTQWIDTGVNLSSKSAIEGSAALANDSTASIAVWGSYSAADKYSLYWHLAKQEGVDAPIGQFQGLTWFGSTTNAEVGKVYHFKQTPGELWIDGELAKARDIEDFSLDFSAALFCVKQPVEEFYYRSSSRIYSFAISHNNQLHLAYVPCLDPEGVPCMYDLMSNQAFRNSGTGQFVVGMTMKQALALANLPAPTTSNTMTISLPKEASLVLYNQDVEAALEQARANGWDIAVQYRDEFEDEAILNKYAECTTIAEVEAVNPDFANDLTSDAEWIYPLPKLQDISDSGNTNPRWPAGVKVWRADLPSLTSAGSMFKYNNSLIEFYGDLPAVIGNGYEQAFESNVFRKFVGSLRSLINGNQFFWYCRNMEEFVSSLSALSTGRYMFVDAKLNKESALCVVNTIPAYTSGSHPLTLGIHIDHKYDPELNLALKKADINYEPAVELTEEVTEGKGWTVDVQWNGTPTSATATFDRGTIIYAKLGEIEHPDGTTEQFLDWGHHVTNWEERGYAQFRSLESAYEYFGLEHETNE